jgi:predicted transcriptional regulator
MTERLGRKLRKIGREIDSIAESILHASPCGADPVQSQLDPKMIRSMLRARRRRNELFDDISGEPAWDMMLDLMAAKLEGKRVSVSSLCIAAGAPVTTALRWIKRLVARGVFLRVRDPEDQRRVYITLASEAEAKLRAYLLETT